MKIYTKTGDGGTTSLAYGGRVEKTHPRVEAYGDVDELVSHLALLRSLCLKEPATAACAGPLRQIECNLMLISSHLASQGEAANLKPIDSGMCDALEQLIDELSAQLPPQTAFIVPGPPVQAAQCHVARTVCRRCERRALAIEDRDPSDVAAAIYLNRLSDYLFVLARYLSFALREDDDFWLP